tara:strand:+ start:860 stop:1594 length:735 start_codon:yes stop_codon:yes gene_type:complete
MKILVIGDSCTDVFVYGQIDRLCPEAPVPIFEPIHQKENGGMASNVKNNLIALGVDVHIISNNNGMKKVRYVDNNSNQMIMRLDENDVCDRVENLLDMSFSEYNAIIISDYDKGFLQVKDIQYICEKYNNVFIDTKKQIDDWIMSADFIKINSIEYKNNLKYINENDKWLKDKLIITRGSEGCLFKGKIYPTQDVPVKDISGAGDTFLAGLVVSYLKTDNILEAINFAQACTTMVVQKQGVSTI